MENIIVLGIVIVSVIINIVKNYQKESKKNSERVIGKPFKQTNRPVVNSDDIPYSPSPTKTYDSLEYNIRTVQANPHELTTSDYIAKYDTEMANIAEDTSVRQDTPSSANIVFETSEELKKAVLYSTILERKF